MQQIYVLMEDCNEDGHLIVTGVFSDKKEAERAQREYSNIFHNHHPWEYRIEEHKIDYHVWKLKEDFNIDIASEKLSRWIKDGVENRRLTAKTRA